MAELKPPLPFSDMEMVEALRTAWMAEKSGRFNPAFIELGPYTAFTPVACLQLAWRHPDLRATQRDIIEQVARPLQAMFDPPLSDSLELGWNVDYDAGPMPI
jgi:hypothetical protein